jgi:hypothetical protein
VDCSAEAADDIRKKIEKAKYINHEFAKLQRGTPLQPISCTISQHHVIQRCRQRHITHTTANRPRSRRLVRVPMLFSHTIIATLCAG